MKEEVAASGACEVCGGRPAEADDLLCENCSRAFTLMLELLRSHPELSAEDVGRIKDVFEWRMNRVGISTGSSQSGRSTGKPRVEQETPVAKPFA
jgi:hypothetical protein